MKTPRFALASLVLAAGLINLLFLPLQLVAASAKEEVLVDFTDVRREREGTEFKVVRNYDYIWGAWDNHVSDIPKRGALIQSPINDGQLGEDNTTVKFDQAPIVELVFIIGNANKASGLNFFLSDSDGTEQQWKISFQGLVPGKEYHFPLDLAKCTAEPNPGKVPGLNLKKINTWRIQGDWTKSAVEVLLIKLVARVP